MGKRRAPKEVRMEECFICDIVAGTGEASTVFEDDIVIAFMCIPPVNPGHVLVVPRTHLPNLADLDDATGAHMFKVTMRIERAIRASGVRCEGTNLFMANGEAAFQEVFHAHMHVFPRFGGDAFKLDADWSARPPREELDEVAFRIRGALD
jgi:histidine triad (HIT) family protein